MMMFTVKPDDVGMGVLKDGVMAPRALPATLPEAEAYPARCVVTVNVVPPLTGRPLMVSGSELPVGVPSVTVP